MDHVERILNILVSTQVGKLRSAERDLRARDREVDDLKAALCEAKMSVVTLAAECDELKCKSGRKTTAADLSPAAAARPPAAGDAPPKSAKKGWFSRG